MLGRPHSRHVFAVQATGAIDVMRLAQSLLWILRSTNGIMRPHFLPGTHLLDATCYHLAERL